MDLNAQNSSSIGILMTDAELVIQVWDAALERMTGVSASEAQGKSLTEIIPDLERRNLLSRFRRVLTEGTIETLAPAFHRFLISCPPVFESKHFSEMRQGVKIAPLRENETILGLIVTIEDVTQRMEREIELAAQLKNSDEAVRLQAARKISNETEILDDQSAAPVINALDDKSWRVRGALVEGLSRRAAPEAITALLNAMRENHLDFGVLNSALQVLRASEVETTETLVEFLRDKDSDLRMQAALALGEQQDAKAVPALLDALGDENQNVRYHAIEALGKLQAREAVQPILEIAETRDFFLSFAALEALRSIPDETIAARIVPLLSDEFLREPAIETLGAAGDYQSIAPLIELLNEDKFSVIPVAGALLNLFNRYKTGDKTGEQIIEAVRRLVNPAGQQNLREAIEGKNETALNAAVKFAGWFNDEEIRVTLASLLEKSNLRESAAEALAQQGSKGVEKLLEKLKAEDTELRQTIINALADVRDGKVTTALIEILQTDEDLRLTIIEILGRNSDERSFNALVDLLGDENAVVRQTAVGTLKSLDFPETASRLCSLLTDANPHIRESAIRVVGALDAENCRKAIFAACSDEDERVRKAAIEQLPGIADDKTLALLIRALKNDAPRIRAAAAKTLGRFKNIESIAALREALRDTDAWTRYFAVRSLGAVRDTESAEILAEVEERDAAGQVRVAAGEVLSKLKSEIEQWD